MTISYFELSASNFLNLSLSLSLSLSLKLNYEILS